MAIDKLKEDKYWLYTAQYEDVLNRSRQLGRVRSFSPSSSKVSQI